MLDKTRTKPSWPPVSYKKVLQERHRRYLRLASDERFLESAKAAYRLDPVLFINDWGVVHEPRTTDQEDSPAIIPFCLFPRQVDFIRFIQSCFFDKENGLNEKSREMGATWCAVWFSVWVYLFFPGGVVGWGTATGKKLDELGNPSTIFEKIRIALRHLPAILLPVGFHESDLNRYRIVNPENDAAIIGEIGDQIGRGGRCGIYFKDESAHYEHPEAIEAALLATTDVQIDISSVSGPNTVFHNKRESGVEWNPKEKMPRRRLRVFVMDWSEDPRKDQQWYDEGKLEKQRQGLGHIWAQEVDRDYGAAVEGIIIPSAWVLAAIDAHLKLDIPIEGGYTAGLDIADGIIGGDTNALTLRRGVVINDVKEWGDEGGDSIRRAIVLCAEIGQKVYVQYDAHGLGSAAKWEYNRLKKEDKMPASVVLVPWLAGGHVVDKEKHLIPHDKKTPKNMDYFKNFKAQAWWSLRMRFWTTYRAVTEEGFVYDTEDCISIPSNLPLLRKIQKELSQPVWTQSSDLKMMVDKVPDGARSPNIADSICMAFFPVKATGLPLISEAAKQWALRPSSPRQMVGRRYSKTR